MQDNKIPLIETKIIDDNSSWSSMSDTEKAVEEPKAQSKSFSQPQTHAPIETEEQRLQRFKINVADLNTLYCVGSIEAMTASDIIVQPGKELLNIDNLLFIKIADKPVILGEIEDVFGPIDCPLYCVKIDDYLRHIRPTLETASPSEVKVYVIRQNATFLDDDDIQSMRTDKGTDACFQTERDCDSSDEESEYRFNQSEHNEYFSKRNKSSYDNKDFHKKVKQNPFVTDPAFIDRYSQINQPVPALPTPGNMLLNYLQHGRQQYQDQHMSYGGMQYQEPQYPSYQYNRPMPHQLNPQNQWQQYPHSQQIPQNLQNPQNPQQQQNNNQLNSFFYQ